MSRRGACATSPLAPPSPSWAATGQALWGVSGVEAVRAFRREQAVLVVKDGDVGATEFSRREDGCRTTITRTCRRSRSSSSSPSGPATPSQPAISTWLDGATSADRLAAGRAGRARARRRTADFPRARRTRMTASPTAVTNAEYDGILLDRPLMAIFRGLGVDRSVELARRAWELGIGAVELPIQSRADVDALTAVAEAGRAEDGSSVRAPWCRRGTSSSRHPPAPPSPSVSPGFDADVVRASAAANSALPGVATAHRVRGGHGAQADVAEGVPASLLGPAWFRAMAGRSPDARFVATGGMDAGNATAFLEAGVRTVAVGSALEDPAQLPRLLGAAASLSATRRARSRPSGLVAARRALRFATSS